MDFDKNVLDANNQMMAHENNVPQTVVDDPTCKLNDKFRCDLIKSILYLIDNINPLGSVESQDDVQSSDSSDEEGTFDFLKNS
jgi:hypothetical protein